MTVVAAINIILITIAILLFLPIAAALISAGSFLGRYLMMQTLLNSKNRKELSDNGKG
jgi:hypothetical protein